MKLVELHFLAVTEGFCSRGNVDSVAHGEISLVACYL